MSSRPLLIQQQRATHDQNGNPRRVWVVFNPMTGQRILSVNEGYMGRQCLMSEIGTDEYYKAIELSSVDITVAEYNLRLRPRK